MFQVKAAFDGRLELRASLERARAFFSDVGNFMRLMPGVEQITREAGGVSRWLIRADVPVLGAVRHSFPVVLAEDTETRIEWSPAPAEQKNFLRYGVTLQDGGAEGVTRANISQRVELRRRHGRELHMLAPLVGAARLSAEMQRGVDEMMRAFLQNARRELES